MVLLPAWPWTLPTPAQTPDSKNWPFTEFPLCNKKPDSEYVVACPCNVICQFPATSAAPVLDPDDLQPTARMHNARIIKDGDKHLMTLGTLELLSREARCVG